MARRAVITDTSRGHLTAAQRSARNEAENHLRIGSVDMYQPVGLDSYGQSAYECILRAMPEEKLAEVDGYTVEIAADALGKMQALRESLDVESIVSGDSAQAKALNAYLKYAGISRSYLIELGCTPSARAKIAKDAAEAISKPKSLRAILAEDDDDQVL